MQHRFEQMAAQLLPDGKLPFPFVAQRHQFIHFRHDSLLFVKGWRANRDLFIFA
jgi:hypothetical protein